MADIIVEIKIPEEKQQEVLQGFNRMVDRKIVLGVRNEDARVKHAFKIEGKKTTENNIQYSTRVIRQIALQLIELDSLEQDGIRYTTAVEAIVPPVGISEGSLE